MTITVTAGQRVTAAMLNAFVPTYSRQTADQSLGTTTFTNHNTWTGLTLNANEIWHATVMMSTFSANAGNDIRVRLETTGTVVLDSYRNIAAPGLPMANPVIGGATVVAPSGSAVDVSGHWQSRATTETVSGGVSVGIGTLYSFWREEFVLNGGVSGGTWGVEWAQNLATSGNTTVLAGSYLIMHRLS